MSAINMNRISLDRKEDVRAEISEIKDYIYSLVEELEYRFQHIDFDGYEAAPVSTDEAMELASVSYNMVKAKGVSADWITAGIIKDKATGGQKIYADLDTGIFKGNFTELSISGETAATQNYAGQAASAAATALDNSLDQTKVFNKLTNNRANQGIYLSGGNLYINASMIAAGTLNADYIKAGTISGVSINIGNGNFTVDSTGSTVIKNSFTRTYTQTDLNRVQAIIMGSVTPTEADLERLDTNGDGDINIIDYGRINKAILTSQGKITFSTELNLDSSLHPIRLGSTYIGNGGIRTESINLFNDNGSGVSIDSTGIELRNASRQIMADIHGILAGHASIYAEAWTHINFGATLPYTPRVFCTFNDSAEGDWACIKVKNVTTTGFDAALGGSGSTYRGIDWLAIC